MYKVYPFLLLVLLSCSIQAQRFTGGFTAGFNACQVDGDSYAGYNKLGLVLGAYTATRLNDQFSAEIQIRYAQKGASKEVSTSSTNLYKSNLHYIEFPVLLRYHYTEKLSWFAGPAAGYLFKHTVEDENGPLPESSISFHKLEIAGMAGLTYQLLNKISVSFAFSYSLHSISDAPHDPIHFRQPGLYNNLFTTTLNYSL